MKLCPTFPFYHTSMYYLTALILLKMKNKTISVQKITVMINESNPKP